MWVCTYGHVAVPGPDNWRARCPNARCLCYPLSPSTRVPDVRLGGGARLACCDTLLAPPSATKYPTGDPPVPPNPTTTHHCGGQGVV